MGRLASTTAAICFGVGVFNGNAALEQYVEATRAEEAAQAFEAKGNPNQVAEWQAKAEVAEDKRNENIFMTINFLGSSVIAAYTGVLSNRIRREEEEGRPRFDHMGRQASGKRVY